MPAPILILLPGLHGTADLFHPLLAVLPNSLSTRILEYPTNRCLSYARHLANFEQQLSGETDLILFAESFSGPLAIEFAARHPTRVRALVLCGTFVTAPVPRLLCLLAPIPILLRCPLPNFLLRLFLGGRRMSSELARECRAAIDKNRPHVVAHRVLQAGALDARRALARCTMPILCIAGTRDRLIGRRSVRRICRARPDAAIRFISAPHLLLQTRPAEAWQHVQTFLEETCVWQSPLYS